MKILITGGAGFIGSHIARLLLDQGSEIVIYDNLKGHSASQIDPRAKLVKGDLANQKLLVDSLQGCNSVIHMAALIEVNQSVADPVLYAENNILGTVHLLEAMRQAKIQQIIFSSSATVYGSPRTLPVDETSEIMAANPYGATKIASESMLSAYHFVHNFDVTILRYFNPYGPGENHQPETHAIPNIIKAALKDEPIPLYWQGQQIRDFIYVEDLARAHIAILAMTGLNIFNVGTDHGVTIIDILNKVSDILGKPVKTKDLGERSGDVPALFASSQALTKATGWKIQVSLEEGLKRTIEYFKSLI